MSDGAPTIGGLKRLSFLPERDLEENGTLLAGQEYDNVYIAGGIIDANVDISGIAFPSVYSFGAVGDGVTDDTAAFQAAATAMGDIGGGRVNVPAGTFIISSTILMPTGAQFCGSGIKGTIIKLANNSNVDMFKNAARDSVNYGLHHLTIDGNRDNNTTSTGVHHISDFPGNGDVAGEANNLKLKLDNVRFFRCATHGMHIEPTGTAIISGLNMNDCQFRQNGENGFKVFVNDSIVTSTVVSGNLKEGIYLAGGANNHYENVKTYYNGFFYGSGNAYGWYGVAVKRSRFIACEAQEDFENGAYFDANSEDNYYNFIVDSNGREATPGTGFIMNGNTNCTLDLTCTSFHTPSWQGTGLKIISPGPGNIVRLNSNNQVTAAYTFTSATNNVVILDYLGRRTFLTTTAGSGAYMTAISEVFSFDVDNGTDSDMRFFRNTNVAGNRRIRIYKGDGTATNPITINARYGTFGSVPVLIANLPSATTVGAGQQAVVSNGASNKQLVISDGTIWRYADGTAV